MTPLTKPTQLFSRQHIDGDSYEYEFSTYRLVAAHLLVLQSQFGTEPQKVLYYALHVFAKSDLACELEQKAFNRIVAVFDRDEHHSYHAALAQATALNEKLKNDAYERVSTKASDWLGRS